MDLRMLGGAGSRCTCLDRGRYSSHLAGDASCLTLRRPADRCPKKGEGAAERPPVEPSPAWLPWDSGGEGRPRGTFMSHSSTSCAAIGAASIRVSVKEEW
jgi:hypothetical protein